MKFDIDFPGGNGEMTSAYGDVITVSPQLRDTCGEWFYWAFRISNASGRTIKFKLELKENPSYLLASSRGPAVKTENGDWRWLHGYAPCRNDFEYRFTDDSPVFFSNTFVFTRRDWGLFAAKYPFTKTSLAKTKAGRDFDLFRTGSANPVHRILLTCRNHSCESAASFVLEGIAAGFIENEYLMKNCELAVLPFMDTDGVENGDQGKNRTPHDHNRDYTANPIYAEVKALMNADFLWNDNKLCIAMDLHNPMLCSDEYVHYPEAECVKLRSAQAGFSGYVENCRTSEILFDAKKALRPFGAGHNQPNRATCGAWMEKLPSVRMVMTLETPYADTLGKAVTPDSAFHFGQDIARAMEIFIRKEL